MRSGKLTPAELLLGAAYATNNAAGVGVDIRDYIVKVEVWYSIGTKTVGDADGSFTIQLQDSATNSAAAAANISGLAVTTTNNTTATGVIVADTRAAKRYLFARVIIAGTNSPSYPAACGIIGEKQVEA